MTAAPTTRAADRNRLSFTPFTLKRIPTPKPESTPDGRVKLVQTDYWDNSTPGFGLRVTSTGTKSWVVMTRLLGQSKVKRFTIGRVAERDGGGLTLQEARREALALKNRIATGENPRQTEEQAKMDAIRRSRHTFGSVVEEFLRVHHPANKAALRPSSLRRYKLVLAGPDLAAWRARPIASITRADVLTVLHNMQARGLGVSCNRALAAIRVLMHHAIQRSLIEVAPTDHVKPVAAEIARDRHLFGDEEHNRPSEIALLWKASGAVGPFGALPKLLLLTGQRRDEVTGMKHSELIDLGSKNPRWSLPPERTKNGKRHLVPLGSEAVRIIQGMPTLADCDFVFSTTGTTAFSGFSNLKDKIDKTIAALKKEHPAKYAQQFKEEWRLHDLRRTCKTAWSDLGVASDVRDALLGHAKPGMDRVYDHSQRAAEKRAALGLWERYVLDLVKAEESQGARRKR
ncbi:MAG: integrase arm-type DNA-binding domain-containing protein [Nitrospiraceae bacterium]|nr:integrase arm-type DNA-binding domain-containing protein [Nitrospiraceae bacterium]